jgi:hypothetical protein
VPRIKGDLDGNSVDGNGKRKKQDDEIAETDSDESNILIAIPDDAAKKRRKNATNSIEDKPAQLRAERKR